jgi:hypothetical protein
MFKTLGMVCIALACAGSPVAGQPSSADQHAPLVQGHPNERHPHTRTPTDAQAIAACIVREQADHTGMSKAEAEAACRARLAPEDTHQRTDTPTRK